MQAAAKTLRLVTEPPKYHETELETLFRAHHDRVFRAAHRITGSSADAEDVLQTVFLRLVRGGATYDLSANPEAYLSRAAINASLDLMRSRGRARSVDRRRRACSCDDETRGEVEALRATAYSYVGSAFGRT